MNNKIDKTNYFDALLYHNNAIIAQIFSNMDSTEKSFSIKNIQYLLSNEIYLFQITVVMIEDNFYITYNHPIKNDDNPVPLSRYFNLVKFRPICTLIQDNTNNALKLYQYCKKIELTPNYCIIQESRNKSLDIFKKAGYKTMKIGSHITKQETKDYDYFCCNNINGINRFQNNPGINKFIYYASDNAHKHYLLMQKYSKIAGCISDNPVGINTFEMTNDLNDLNYYDGYKTTKIENHNSDYKDVRYYIDDKGDKNIVYAYKL